MKLFYKMTKEGKNPKGEPYKPVICKSKIQKAAFVKYGFKSTPLRSYKMVNGKPEEVELDIKNITKEQLLDELFAQEGKVTGKQQVMTKSELMEEI